MERANDAEDPMTVAGRSAQRHSSAPPIVREDRSITRTLALALLTLGLITGHASAQAGGRLAQPLELVGPTPESPTPELIDSLLLGLDDESFAERERSFLALAEMRSLTLKHLEALLDRPNLSAEQRMRVLTLARERFVTSPRAAMGVQFYTNASGGTGLDSASAFVAIENLVPGFRSAEVLKPGDVIVEINGFKLSGPLSRDMVRAHIISRDPGDELPIIIRRGEQRMEVRVILGSYMDLASGSPIFPRDMARAWWARMGERTVGAEKIRPKDSTLSRSAWPSAVWVAQEAAQQARAVRILGRSTPQMLGAGGAGHSLEPDPGEQVMADGVGGVVGAAWANQGQIIRQGNVIVVDRRRGFAQPEGWLDFDQPPVRTLEQEIARLEEDERLLRQRLPEASDRQQTGDVFGLTPRQRIERSLQIIPIIRKALEAELRERGDRRADDERGADARADVEERSGG